MDKPPVMSPFTRYILLAAWVDAIDFGMVVLPGQRSSVGRSSA